MKKILAITVVMSAFAISCSPYYPWDVEDIGLGAATKVIECSHGVSSRDLDVISNVDYEASIIEGTEWISFADTDEKTKSCSVETTKLSFDIAANRMGKRLGRVVLSHGTRQDTIKVKQQGVREDLLAFNTTDQSHNLDANNVAFVPREGKSFVFRLETTALDHEIKMEAIGRDMITDFKVENHVLYFTVTENLSGQPRIVDLNFYFIDGWEERVQVSCRMRQEYN